MPVTVTRLPDEPIILVILSDPFDSEADIPEIGVGLGAVLDAADQPLWGITDLTQMKKTPHKDALKVVRGQKHAKLAGMAIVLTNDLVRLTSNALSLGGVKTTMYKDFDDALEDVRGKIRQRASRPV